MLKTFFESFNVVFAGLIGGISGTLFVAYTNHKNPGN
tara:strand:+ start:1251 stop:1361 length:111 start_codon:yes stop_codon:yes gene_type:complete